MLPLIQQKYRRNIVPRCTQFTIYVTFYGTKAQYIKSSPSNIFFMRYSRWVKVGVPSGGTLPSSNVKNLLFIRNPVILRSFREVNDEESVLDKFFVLCELFMHNFSVKRDVISVFFLLLVLDEGQSLRCSDQRNTFTLAKFLLEILVPHQNVLDISHFWNPSQPTLEITHKTPCFVAVAFSIQKQWAFHFLHVLEFGDRNE